MIKCPKCNHTLPVNYTICQFCGADVSMVPRPKAEEQVIVPRKTITKGTLIGLYAMCILYIILGGFQFCAGMGLFGSVGDFMKNFYMIFGGLMALIGFGMLFRPAFIYGMMGAFCAIQLVLGIVDIIASVMTVDTLPLRIGLIVEGVLQMIAAGFMFYFSEETAVTSMTAT